MHVGTHTRNCKVALCRIEEVSLFWRMGKEPDGDQAESYRDGALDNYGDGEVSRENKGQREAGERAYRR